MKTCVDTIDMVNSWCRKRPKVITKNGSYHTPGDKDGNWKLPSWKRIYPFAKALLKTMFLFPRWDMFVPRRVPQKEQENSLKFIFWGSFSSFCNWAKLWNSHMGADVLCKPHCNLVGFGFMPLGPGDVWKTYSATHARTTNIIYIYTYVEV